MLLEILIATVAIFSWPLIFAIHYRHEIRRFLSQRFSWRHETPTESDLPPLSLPMRYDHGMKKSAEADDEAPLIRVMGERQQDTTPDEAE